MFVGEPARGRFSSPGDEACVIVQATNYTEMDEARAAAERLAKERG